MDDSEPILRDSEHGLHQTTEEEEESLVQAEGASGRRTKCVGIFFLIGLVLFAPLTYLTRTLQGTSAPRNFDADSVVGLGSTTTWEEYKTNWWCDDFKWVDKRSSQSSLSGCQSSCEDYQFAGYWSGGKGSGRCYCWWTCKAEGEGGWSEHRNWPNKVWQQKGEKFQGWLTMKDFKATQSSTSGGDGASKATDGHSDPNIGAGSCTHTRGGGWWQVDLGKPYNIEKVIVTNRGDCCSERLNGFKLLVDDSKCADGPSNAPGGDIKVDCKATGSKVKIEVPRTFSICEVKIKTFTAVATPPTTGDVPHRYDFVAVGAGWCLDGERKSLKGYVKDGLAHADCAAACQHETSCSGYAYDWGKKQSCMVYASVETSHFSGWKSTGGSTKDVEQTKYSDMSSEVVCFKATAASGEDHYEGAIPWPNVELVTRGYNVYEGDPSPITAASDEADFEVTLGKTLVGMKKMSMDPGLKKPLFTIDYSQRILTSDQRHTVPDGYHVTNDVGCATATTTKKIRDVYEYSNEQMNEVALTAKATSAAYFPHPDKMSKSLEKYDVSAGLKTSVSAYVSAKRSLQFKDMNNESRSVDRTMYRSSAKCSAYVAAISLVKPPKTHPEFQKAVDEASSPEDWYQIFDDFGTDMLSLVKAGARFTSSAIISNEQSADIRTRVNGMGFEVEAAVGASLEVVVGYKDAEASVLGSRTPSYAKKWTLPLMTPPEKVAAEENSNLIERATVSVVGSPLPPAGASLWHEMVKTNPVPFKFDTRDICMHPAISEQEDTFCMCHQSQLSYCREHLVKKGASCEPAVEKECWEDLDCKEGSVCRETRCTDVPQCQGTAWTGRGFTGGSYALPKVDSVRHPGGMTFSLQNGDFADSLKSFHLSEGCYKAELVDDDGHCTNGKHTNLIIRDSLESLPGDLEEDVCQVKLWPKPVPLPPPRGDRAGYISKSKMTVADLTDGDDPNLAIDGDPSTCWSSKWSHNAIFVLKLDEEYYVDAIRIQGRSDEFARNHLRGLQFSVLGSESGFCPTDEILNLPSGPEGHTSETVCGRRTNEIWIERGPREPADHLSICEVDVKVTLKKSAPPPSAPAATSCPSRRLRENVEQRVVRRNSSPDQTARRLGATERKQYLPNVGKAMYGYNIFYGAPSSVETAGTDPGFQFRPIWKATYKQNKKVDHVEFFDVPGFRALKRLPAGVTYKKHSKVRMVADFWRDFHEVDTVTKAKSNCDQVPVCVGYTCNIEKCWVMFPRYSTLRYEDNDDFVSYVKESYDQTVWLEKHVGKTVKTNPQLGIFSSIGKAKEACVSKATCTGVRCTVDEGKCELGEGTVLSDDSQFATYVLRGRSYAFSAGVAQRESLLVPDGWQAYYGVSPHCDAEYQGETLKSEYDYDASQDLNLNPTGLSLAIGDFTFSASFESKHFEKSSSKYRKAMLKSTAECVEYILRMQTKPQSTDNFQFAVDAVNDEQSYHFVFQMFGLHYPVEMVFGSRYGFTQMITESDYETVTEEMEKWSVGVEYAKGFDKGNKAAKGELTVSSQSAYSESEASKKFSNFSSYFKEKKEFSLGTKLPREGGAKAWAAQSKGEAMPIRWAMESLCEHPAWGSKKANCEKYHKTFCSNFLQRQDPDVRCDKQSSPPECAWDMDCHLRHVCQDSVCVKEPDCKVNIGNKWYGPYYLTDTPQGRVVSLSGKMGQVTMTGGCAQVVLYDEDACRDNYEDNLLLQNLDSDETKNQNLPDDLVNDVCAMKVYPKKYWAQRRTA